MDLVLHLQTRVELFNGSGQWEELTVPKISAPNQVALLICDMWDQHWCKIATQRCDTIARQMAPVVDAARAHGVLIIHAPSGCMAFYQGIPQRQRMLSAPKVTPPAERELAEPPLPFDYVYDEHGCEDTPICPLTKPWTREHPAIHIGAEDGISDDGAEVYNVLRQQQRTMLLIAGVHTNMCVLRRSFAIRQMSRWGIDCALVRDLTDAFYVPTMPPYVSHDQGTELVVQHIEQYLCPSIASEDLMLVPTVTR
jgi:nicotinamidase-related amidase